MGGTLSDKMQGMGVTLELQNLGDAQLGRDIAARIEHAFADRQGSGECPLPGPARELGDASGITEWL